MIPVFDEPMIRSGSRRQPAIGQRPWGCSQRMQITPAGSGRRMWSFVFCLFVLVAMLAPATQATVYYVDCAAANDSGAGTSPASAWKTIAEVNASSFVAGDSILFNRGCAWREQLTVP